jgi:hypothetical protein
MMPAGTTRYALLMKNDFWFQVGVVGLGTLPVLMAAISLFLE